MSDLLERVTVCLADRYTVVRRLGGGGMADVFLARDVRHGRDVAIKILRPAGEGKVDRDRFLREIGIAARLHHPHILPLFDSGDAEGLLYYVMPYMEDETLRTRLRRVGRLPVPEAVRIARELGDALDFAHGHGIVHRDVKPENILLLANHAVIADFGIACLANAEAEENLTATGMIVGTPTYMSPEQVFGEAALDGRSDQYSLACIVYEMLSGQPPFTGPTARSIIAGHYLSEAPTLAARVVAVPAMIEEALRRALAKDPDERFPKVRDFADALQGTATFVAAPPPVRSLLVIPFANQGGDADTEFLSDGLSEELIHTLNALEGLRVVGRTSAFAFKGTTEDVREIGRRLGVEVVLEGSVRRAGQRLRITAQLTGVSDGLQIWSERFEREAGDAFVIQDEIAAAILAALRLTLLGRSPPRVSARTDSPRAYELYLRGRHSWNTRTETGLHRSVAFLKDAIAADAAFSLAHAALAESYVTLGVYGAADPREVMPLAEAEATAAIAKDFRLAEAHGALGAVQALYHWRWGEAEASYRRALSANPSAGLVRHGLAVNVLMPQGRWDQARNELERARALEPLAPALALSLGLIPYYRGDFAAAAAAFREVVATDETFAISHFFLGQALARLGHIAEAGQVLERAQQLAGPSPEILAARAWLQALSGKTGAAREALEQLIGLRPTRYVSPVLEARVLMALEEKDAALEAVTRGVEGRAADAVWLGARPMLAGLRDEPRFLALLARMGLAAG